MDIHQYIYYRSKPKGWHMNILLKERYRPNYIKEINSPVDILKHLAEFCCTTQSEKERQTFKEKIRQLSI